MLRKIPVKLLVALAIIALLVVLDFFFHKSIFNSAKDKVYELLHRSEHVMVKNDSEKITNRELLKKYFDSFGYQKTWTDTTHENNKYRTMLAAMLNYADSLGLDRKDYHEEYIAKYDSLLHQPGFDYNEYESENELIFSDAALSFLYHVAYGKEINIGFNGVKYNIDSARITQVYNNLLVHQNWRLALDTIEPKTSQYLTLKKELNHLQTFLRNHPEADSVKVSATTPEKDVLILKLKAYNLIPDSLSDDSVSSVDLRTALKNLQRMMNADTTGKADAVTAIALNFSLSKRAGQIKESLNYWRWTGRLKEKEFILVNIPAARLQIVREDSTKDVSMKVIVGKTATKTPQFTAYISKVITYPYWTVPISIATKEMLPKIRRRISYLEDNNLQVINSKGIEVDPKTVGWERFSEKYFPYTLRQSTGCDNSLGVLKFDLNSPYSIYLHDTNNRNLFGKKERFLSHGCVRLEKPMVLAEYVLREGLDTSSVSKLNACMKEQQPKDFILKKRFPVLIFYMTTDVDENGNLKFYNDVYADEKKKPA
jgi:murein L,D-transpeptidase YcbB/YkuD